MRGEVSINFANARSSRLRPRVLESKFRSLCFPPFLPKELQTTNVSDGGVGVQSVWDLLTFQSGVLRFTSAKIENFSERKHKSVYAHTPHKFCDRVMRTRH